MDNTLKTFTPGRDPLKPRSRLRRLVDSSPSLLTLDDLRTELCVGHEYVVGETENILHHLQSERWSLKEVHALNEDCLTEIHSRVEPLVSAVDDLMFVATGRRLKGSTLDRAYANYAVLAYQNELEAWFKWNTVYLAAMLFKEARLPAPKYATRPGAIMGGAFFRYSRSLLNRKVTEKVTFFAASILQLKRAARPIPEVKIKASLDDHQRLLGTERPNKHRLAVKRTIKEMVRDGRIFKSDPANPWVLPSSSAHFGESRQTGGALGVLHRNFIVPEGINLLSKVLVGYTRNPPRGGPPCPIYVPSMFETLGEAIREKARDEPMDCEVHTILEPCKVRTITAGPSLRYHIARTVQKRVFQQLRKNKYFRLCGEPLSAEILNDHYADVPSILGAPERGTFVSADYSSATDLLDGQLGAYAVKQIAKALELDPETRDIYLESMTGHVLHYPMEYGGETVTQVNGQLMGSPSSFPVLCIINAAILVTAWREYANTWEAREEIHPSFDSVWGDMAYLRPLVNGDDLFFRCPTGSFYDFWWDYATECGLKPSAGKNYVSDRMGTLNSEYYLIQSEQRFGRQYFENGRWRYTPPCYKFTFSKIHWFNTGLARGQSKVLSDTRKLETGTVDWTSVGAKLNKLLSGHTGSVRKRIEHVWFRHNREVLFSTDRSWKIPVVLGGLGLPLSGEGGATRPQLALAHYIVKTGDRSFSTKSEAVGSELQEEIFEAQRRLMSRFCQEVRRYSDTYSIIDGVIHDHPTTKESAVPTYILPLTADPLARVKKVTRHRKFRVRMEAKLRSVNIGPLELDDALEYARFNAWLGRVEFPVYCFE